MMQSAASIKQLCQQYDLRPSARYGQNFLTTEGPLKKMADAAELSPADTVVEVGPGFGQLTFFLSPRVKRLVAFEIEKKLQPYWEERLTEFPNVEIVWGNALTHLPSFISNFPSSYKVVANIPYQITSHLLRVLFEQENKPERVVLMVQKEVAERICAKPPDMSLLSVSVQYYGEPRIAARVGRGNFWPEPAVDSAIVVIDCTKSVAQAFRPDHKQDQAFFKIAKAGFAHKRKQLWRNLAVGLSVSKEKAQEAVRAVCGNEKARAEELSVAQWHLLVDKLAGGEY